MKYCMFIIFDKISNISRNIFSISAKIFEISYAFFIFIYLITESISFPIYIINKMSETYYIYLRTAHYVSKISFTFEKL